METDTVEITAMIEREYLSSGELKVILPKDLDAISSRAIRPEFESLSESESPVNVVLDMSRVTFLDSSGIGAIVFLYKRLLNNQGSLVIDAASGQPRKLLELLRVNKAIPTKWS